MHIRRSALLLSLSVLALAPLIAFAWTGPSAAPPGNNVAAPINVGTTDQVKNGNIGVNGLAVFGNSLFGGSTGSNAYLNFGATAGASGYGIRDNAGTLEFKNSAGSWASIQSTVFNLVGGTGSWTASSNNISNTNSGNVGIGTASPGAKLAVTSPTNGVRVNSWVDVNSSACGLAGIGQNVYLNQADNSYKWANTHGGIGGSLIELGTCSGSAYNDIVFLRASGTTGSIPTTANATAAMTESVRITSSGNVGIGTAYPVAKLNVVGGGVVVGSANPVANYWIWGDGYLNVYGPVQAARYVDDQQQFYIDLSDGAHVRGPWKFENAPQYSSDMWSWCESFGDLVKRDTLCSPNIPSDARHKNTITPLPSELDRILQLKPVSFHWNTDYNSTDPALQYGFIAQDMLNVFPNLISTSTADGMYVMNFIGLQAPMVKAIQEQQAEIESQNAEIESLKADIEELRSAVGSNRL